MIAFKCRCIYGQYLPTQPIKMWMYCDAYTAYLHQLEVYFGQQQKSEFGL